MISDGENWHCLAVKSCLHYLEYSSKHEGDFYCLNCFHSYSTKKNKIKNEKQYSVCKNHNYYVEMPNQDKMLKYNHGEKSKSESSIY